MTTTSRKHTVHIKASAPMVFKYIEDPVLAYAKLLGTEIIDVSPTSEGIGTTWKSVAPPTLLGIHFAWDFTREDQVVDARIVDVSSTGVRWIWTLEPVHHGDTELTLEMVFSEPFMLDKILMVTIGRHADEEMQQALTALKLAIET